MEAKSKLASRIFEQGLNCAQSVLVSFKDETGLPESTLLSLGSGFGGGMARQQMTCGAVTGAYMVLGLKLEKECLSVPETKKKSAQLCKQFSTLFLEKYPSLICREILGADMNTAEGQSFIEKNNLYSKTCARCVENAVQILENL